MHMTHDNVVWVEQAVAARGKPKKLLQLWQLHHQDEFQHLGITAFDYVAQSLYTRSVFLILLCRLWVIIVYSWYCILHKVSLGWAWVSHTLTRCRCACICMCLYVFMYWEAFSWTEHMVCWISVQCEYVAPCVCLLQPAKQARELLAEADTHLASHTLHTDPSIFSLRYKSHSYSLHLHTLSANVSGSPTDVLQQARRLGGAYTLNLPLWLWVHSLCYLFFSRCWRRSLLVMDSIVSYFLAFLLSGMHSQDDWHWRIAMDQFWERPPPTSRALSAGKLTVWNFSRSK